MTAKRFKVISLYILVTMLAVVFLTSCAATDYYMGSSDIMMEDAAMETRYVQQEPAAAEKAPDTDYDTMVHNGRVGEGNLRHVIRTGSIELTVKDTRETINEVRSIVEQSGGMISNSNVYEAREDQYNAHLTLRVQNNDFDRVMDRLQNLGKARNVQTGTDDVTMQYIDLESRLNNQKAQEERLIEILDIAETLEEVLEVERELHRVRGEIETMTARLNHLKDQVSYATINLTIREETVPTEEISPLAFENLGESIGQAFIGSINFILKALSFMVVAFAALLPVLIILGITAVLIFLLVRKFSKRKKTSAGELESGQE